jgi:hypothetical protein
MVNWLEAAFPKLAGSSYAIRSERSKHYNCIAWAAGDTLHWWWPTPAHVQETFWPAGVAREEETLAAFRLAFALIGYVECESEGLEPGFEKIALFANPQGIPVHAARQRPEGMWTSKLGEVEDIDHALRYRKSVSERTGGSLSPRSELDGAVPAVST